jgi:hypothetical protein
MKLNAVLLLLNILAIILILSQIRLLQDIKNILQEKQTNNNLDETPVDKLPVDETPVDKVPVKQSSRKAMTWVLEDKKEEGNRFYGLFGVGNDNRGNPYVGDTETSNLLPILCISKENLPKPSFIVQNITPGGALRASWSGSKALFTEPIQGIVITSRNEGNRLCQLSAKKQLGINSNYSNYVMAEFHDGDQSGWAGWSFWVDMTDVYKNTYSFDFLTSKYWVAISDQQANPWD